MRSFHLYMYFIFYYFYYIIIIFLIYNHQIIRILIFIYIYPSCIHTFRIMWGHHVATTVLGSYGYSHQGGHYASSAIIGSLVVISTLNLYFTTCIIVIILCLHLTNKCLLNSWILTLFSSFPETYLHNIHNLLKFIQSYNHTTNIFLSHFIFEEILGWFL